MTDSTVPAEASQGRETPAFMLALIEQDLAAQAAAEQAGEQRGAAAAERAWRLRGGSRNTSSVVFTLRLGREDFAALHRQAAMRSVPPSALARNLIRYALAHPEPDGTASPGSDLTSLAGRVRLAAHRANRP